MTATTQPPTQSPAQRRGFCVDPETSQRVYLVPRGLVWGSASARAVSAGSARLLAGGPIGFTSVEIVRRGSDGSGERRPASIRDVPDFLVPQLLGLSAPRPSWAGLQFSKPCIMGVINVTPDSFSDGGDFVDPARAIAHGHALMEAGADILDVGGESTRPGAAPISIEEEVSRVIPVIEGLVKHGAIVSIDTRHSAVMRAAVAAGARIINDVTALTGDPDAESAAAETGASLVLMHMQGDPATMQKEPRYLDATCDLLDYFDERLQRLLCIGVPLDRIALDPGIGFGKKDPHNFLLLEELAAFQVFGCPVVLGVSRKSFIGRNSRGEPPKERVAGTIAADQTGLDRGVQIVRVHDVAEACQARAVWHAITGI